MKTKFTLLVLLISTIAWGQSNTESQIKNLSQKRIEWLLKGNVDSLSTLYDGNSLTVHTNGMIKSKDEHLTDVKSGRPVYKSIVVKSMIVKDFGKTAVLVGQGEFKIEMGGKEMIYNMVYTEVYQNTDGNWKLITRHASSMQ